MTLPRSYRSLPVFCGLAFFTLHTAPAQGTIRFDLSGLPPGQTLGEQFAANGIHFTTYGNAAAAVTVPAPAFFAPAGQTLGEGRAFAILFDQPIASFAFDIGQSRSPGGASFPSWRITGQNNSGLFVTSGGNFVSEQRHHADVTYSASLGISSLAIEGFRTAGETFSEAILFDNIEVTFIPEPTVGFLLLAGLGILFCRCPSG